MLVAAENTSRNSWYLGRKEQMFPDKKGFVRRVKVYVKLLFLRVLCTTCFVGSGRRNIKI